MRLPFNVIVCFYVILFIEKRITTAEETFPLLDISIKVIKIIPFAEIA